MRQVSTLIKLPLLSPRKKNSPPFFLFQAGNFVDLAAKKFYDGMEIQRADGFVVQTVREMRGELKKGFFVFLREEEREEKKDTFF